MIRVTKGNALEITIDIWTWLAETGGLKYNWPGWEENGGLYASTGAYCPLCTVYPECHECPLTKGGGNCYSFAFGNWSTAGNVATRCKYAAQFVEQLKGLRSKPVLIPITKENALDIAIELWEWIAGTNPKVEDKGTWPGWDRYEGQGGTFSCPFCVLYYKDSCEGCPLIDCYDTPFGNWEDTGDVDEEEEWDEERLAAAVKFLEFLRGLESRVLKKYEVELHFCGHFSTQVTAINEDEAVRIAREEADGIPESQLARQLYFLHPTEDGDYAEELDDGK